MIYLKLIYKFFVIGLLSFGGGYSTIPLVKDIVDDFEVLNLEMLENFIAISESTPGPIAINLATFVGTEVSGIFGGILASLFEILPSFAFILVFAIFFKKYINNKNVKFSLSIVRPCIVGIIMSVGITMFTNGILPTFIKLNKIFKFLQVAELTDERLKYYMAMVDEYSTYIAKYKIISLILIVIIVLFNKLLKRKLSSIKIIILGAILGIAINNLM